MSTPTNNDKLSFSLWTVSWQGRDSSGDANLPALDLVEAAHPLTSHHLTRETGR